jgi:two-component system chemotaxis response regulator CheB
MLDDGAAGLWSIKRQGGTAIVQDPAEAEYPAMPQNAMDTAEVDSSLPAAEIGKKLLELAAETVRDGDEDAPESMLDEVRMATENDSNIEELDRLGERTPFTCPECGGVLWELSDTGNPRFRCHVGHAYSMVTFEAEQAVRVEAALWAALRVLEENERLARRLADAAAERGNKRSQTYHDETAKSSAQHAVVLRDMLEQPPLSEAAPEEHTPKTKKRH